MVAPTAFGRVFEANRSALVRVRARPEAGSPRPLVWATGFLIGAEGEVVFGVTKGLTLARTSSAALVVELDDGAELPAELLGFDRALGLAIARAHPGEGRARRYFTPLRVARERGLERSRWVMVMKHDARGRAEPFAGEVEGEPALDARRSSPLHALIAPVLVPGSAGCPVLSAEGELIGVALLEGARRTEVAAIESLVPFLQSVVLGSAHERR